jgi:hypothetical protein
MASEGFGRKGATKSKNGVEEFWRSPARGATASMRLPMRGTLNSRKIAPSTLASAGFKTSICMTFRQRFEAELDNEKFLTLNF